MYLKHRNRLTIKQMCENAEVSTSGYYAWMRSSTVRKEREAQDRKDFVLVQRAYDFRNRNKGARSIKMTLFRQYQTTMNLKKIRRLMKKYGLLCPIRKANPYKKIAKALKSHIIGNKVNRNFDTGIPGKVLLTDITYLYCDSGRKRAYLSTIKDGCTKQIPAYSLKQTLEMPIVEDTIQMLLKNDRYSIAENACLHSDQGFHYTNPSFQNRLKELSIEQSMSRKGNCWDNAPQESFFGHMKDELNCSYCKTIKELHDEINDYMDYYNNHRYQWGLLKMSPNEFSTYLKSEKPAY
jgi:putative transposase